MKKVSLLALTVSAAAVTLASAQAPVAVSNPCPCPKAFQGFHLGGNVGYGTGGGKVSVLNTFVAPPGQERATYNIRARGFDGGLSVGYTHRFCNYGLGLEGVFNWASTKGQNTDTGGALLHRVKLRNSIQLRANFSYVICNLVAPKIILGWDNSQWTRTFNNPAVLINATNKKRYNGFLWGAGVDFLLAKHVIAGLEYTGVASSKKSFQLVSPAVTQNFSLRPEYSKFALTIKLIY
jgi:opacity protein-like surface antigen